MLRFHLVRRVTGATFSVCPQVNFMLEFEFSCTSLHSRVQMKLHAAR